MGQPTMRAQRLSTGRSQWWIGTTRLSKWGVEWEFWFCQSNNEGRASLQKTKKRDKKRAQHAVFPLATLTHTLPQHAPGRRRSPICVCVPGFETVSAANFSSASPCAADTEDEQ